MIDLRRLQVLRAVAYYGTVTAAAESLHLTPSAASQQIRQLGRELGVTLLEPQGRRVRLTAGARCLLAHADAIEARWQEAAADLHATDGQPAGELRMAGFPTAMCTLLAPAAAMLQDRYPRLEVRLREAEPAHCFDLLFSGETDLAVVEASSAGPARGDRRFEQHVLIDDPFDLLVHPDHPFAARTEVGLAEAAGERWILGTPGSWCRQHVMAACGTAGFSPNLAHEAIEWSVVAALVALRLGVSLVPRLVKLPPEESVRRVPLTGSPVPSRKFLTVVRRGAGSGLAVSSALAVLGEQARGSAAGVPSVAAAAG